MSPSLFPKPEPAAPNARAPFASRILSFTGEADRDAERSVAIETPIAFEYNGFGYAVMMATPADLEDFAVGFTLAERLVDNIRDIAWIETAPATGGWIVRVKLHGDHGRKIADRVRVRVSEGSCGLCGLETIEQVLRPLPAVTECFAVSREAIAAALDALNDLQPLGSATGAAHAAAFCNPDGSVALVREDVGRHNALDKLIGALAREGIDPRTGFLLLTARCSSELVEKAALAGCPLLVTISAPTSLAVERAKACGLALVALARQDTMLVLNDPRGMIA